MGFKEWATRTARSMGAARSARSARWVLREELAYELGRAAGCRETAEDVQRARAVEQARYEALTAVIDRHFTDTAPGEWGGENRAAHLAAAIAAAATFIRSQPCTCEHAPTDSDRDGRVVVAWCRRCQVVAPLVEEEDLMSEAREWVRAHGDGRRAGSATHLVKRQIERGYPGGWESFRHAFAASR
jgi:hypothetical protein